MTVAILTMGRTDCLVSAVESVVPQLCDGDELLVLDQCSGSCQCETRLRALKGAEGIRFERRAGLSGLPAARNLALELAGADWVFFLDDDAELRPNSLASIREVIATGEYVGVGGAQTTTPNRLWYWWYRLFWRGQFREKRQEVNFGRRPAPLVTDAPLPGGAMAIRRDVALDVQFDERLVRYAMGEDIEFSNRLRIVGRTCLVPAARFDHGRVEAGRDRAPAVEICDAMTATHYIYFALPRRSRADLLSYLWVHVGFVVRALIASVRSQSTLPLRGWLAGLRAMHNGLRDVQYIRHGAE